MKKWLTFYKNQINFTQLWILLKQRCRNVVRLVAFIVHVAIVTKVAIGKNYPEWFDEH
jgi:hypothetical protein